MSYLEWMDTIKTACAVGGFVFAAMAWWKANRIASKQVVISATIEDIKKQTDGLTKALVVAEKETSRREGVNEGVAIAASIEVGKSGAGYEEMKTPPKRG